MAGLDNSDKDVEAQKKLVKPLSSEEETKTQNVPHERRTGILNQLQRGEAWLDKKLGIETQGVNRILEEDKCPPSEMNMFLLWWSLNCHVGTIPIGFIGPEMGLSFKQCVVAIVVGTLFGAICSAFCGTLGPKLGLRGIATTRYSFGFYGSKLCSIINIVLGIGFAIVNVVIVGQILSAVSDYKMSLILGCIVIGVISYLVSLFGFQLIHSYEKYAWIASLISFCILLGQIGKKVDTTSPPISTGLTDVGIFLTFLAINFSSASGWSPIVADYLCNYPAELPSLKVWLYTYIGISLPTIFTTMVGVCLGNIACNVSSPANTDVTTYVYPVFAKAYKDHGLGGILRDSYQPLGFSKVILVALAFSVIGNNIAINYSTGLSIQLLSPGLQKIPRFFLSFLVAITTTVLAILGRERLSEIVSDFVGILGYWAICFTLILAIEDKLFRRKLGYDLNAWDSPTKLPWGVAAIFTSVVSYLAGGLPGMTQTWFIGPISKKIFGEKGGDIGIYLSGVLTIIIYIPARWYERKKGGY